MRSKARVGSFLLISACILSQIKSVFSIRSRVNWWMTVSTSWVCKQTLGWGINSAEAEFNELLVLFVFSESELKSSENSSSFPEGKTVWKIQKCGQWTFEKRPELSLCCSGLPNCLQFAWKSFSHTGDWKEVWSGSSPPFSELWGKFPRQS